MKQNMTEAERLIHTAEQSPFWPYMAGLAVACGLIMAGILI